MSLEISLNAPTTIVRRPAETETVEKLIIDRIIDVPSERKVIVFVLGERIELDSLSGDNYDTPTEWSNNDIINAVKTYYNV